VICWAWEFKVHLCFFPFLRHICSVYVCLIILKFERSGTVIQDISLKLPLGVKFSVAKIKNCR
jgi:hypothetical protein